MPLLGAAAWLGAVAGTLARGGWPWWRSWRPCSSPSALPLSPAGDGASLGTVVVAALLVAARRRAVTALRADQVGAQPGRRAGRRAGRRHRRRHGHLRPARWSPAGSPTRWSWRLERARGLRARPDVDWPRRCWCSARRTRPGPAGRDGAAARAAGTGRRPRPGRRCCSPTGDPEVRRRPRARGGAAAAAVRESLRDSVAHRPGRPAGAGARAGGGDDARSTQRLRGRTSAPPG